MYSGCMCHFAPFFIQNLNSQTKMHLRLEFDSDASYNLESPQTLQKSLNILLLLSEPMINQTLDRMNLLRHPMLLEEKQNKFGETKNTSLAESRTFFSVSYLAKANTHTSLHQKLMIASKLGHKDQCVINCCIVQTICVFQLIHYHLVLNY